MHTTQTLTLLLFPQNFKYKYFYTLHAIEIQPENNYLRLLNIRYVAFMSSCLSFSSSAVNSARDYQARQSIFVYVCVRLIDSLFICVCGCVPQVSVRLMNLALS